MSTLVCPACGSTDIVTSERTRQFSVPFGPLVSVPQTNNVCSVCGEEGDFAGANDTRITLARHDSAKESVPKMLATLAASGITMAYIERALELPVRTVARWKSGDFSAAPLALLRIIATFPWMLEVAERGFKREHVNTAVMNEGLKILRLVADASGATYAGQVNRTESYVEVKFSAKVPTVDEAQIGTRLSLIAQRN